MKKKPVVTVLLLSLGAVVLIYNYWAYRCGRCTVTSFFSLNPLATFLLLGNICAVLTLTVLRIGRRRRRMLLFCGTCRNILKPFWSYCPDCGVATGHRCDSAQHIPSRR